MGPAAANAPEVVIDDPVSVVFPIRIDEAPESILMFARLMLEKFAPLDSIETAPVVFTLAVPALIT